MDTTQLKKYAIQARRDFRGAVAARARRIGVAGSEVQEYSIAGDLLIVGEQVFPKDYKPAFDKLYLEINAKGFEAVIEEYAYTWFNRFVALRFMELHDYLPHGYRVLSSKDSDPTPEILRNPLQVDFSSNLNKKLVLELFEAGNKEEELYRTLLIAQCNELNSIMPFLFEKVSDVSELLLPDNLLASDSVIRTLVSDVNEAQWHEGVEIIGWIYQYYISEKKDEVIGKVVKSEDIPAATQLFTPNWIVKYLVQNSVGAYWLGTYSDSKLKSSMEYYIEPAKQDAEVIAELRKITPPEIQPEAITVLDPACGSGHILVEAYNILKEIYLERGYRPREIPRLILEKNLFGLDIDARAAQLASFALLMRARADDSSIFSSDNPVTLNILEIVEADFEIGEAVQTLTKGQNLHIKQMSMAFIPKPLQTELPLTAPGVLSPGDLKEFLKLFEEAKTFGSLITIPPHIEHKLGGIVSFAQAKLSDGDIFEKNYAAKVLRLCGQARILTGTFDAVVANPPYMGNRYLNKNLKKFIGEMYGEYNKDLFAAFSIAAVRLTVARGYVGLVCPFVWMFLSSFEKFRLFISQSNCITSLIKPSYTAFFESAIVPLSTFCLKKQKLNYNARFFDLGYLGAGSVQAERFKGLISDAESKEQYCCRASDFLLLPGAPIAFWVSKGMRRIFRDGRPLGEIAEPKQGLATTDNNRFLRRWWEPGYLSIGFGFNSLEDAVASPYRWFPYNKGGDFRKWYGNQEYIVDWANNGESIKASVTHKYPYLNGNVGWVVKNSNFYFKPGVTWTFISSSKFGVRFAEAGSIFDVAGSTVFPPNETDIAVLLGLLLAPVAYDALRAVNPTLNFQAGNVAQVPIPATYNTTGFIDKVQPIVQTAIEIAKADWDMHERSWNFKTHPIFTSSIIKPTLKESYKALESYCKTQTSVMRDLETNNNRIFIEAYGLSDEISPEVPESEITLHRPAQREDIWSILSYAVGCALGRYSLDSLGLSYANTGNIDFDLTRYKKFPADSDGVIPLLDYPWFTDDMATRFSEFLTACWSEDTLSENLAFVAESLDQRRGVTAEETIRLYFCEDFFKNHLKMYKKRPIYWLFSSGKEKAFQALVYLHRYNEQTLSKMRANYVLPLQGKMSNEEKRLASQAESAGSPAEKSRIKKELEKLRKQQTELRKFDELLHHYADKRIALDLDDGVKVNYGKFGDLLAEVKQVTGGKED